MKLCVYVYEPGLQRYWADLGLGLALCVWDCMCLGYTNIMHNHPNQNMFIISLCGLTECLIKFSASPTPIINHLGVVSQHLLSCRCTALRPSNAKSTHHN